MHGNGDAKLNGGFCHRKFKREQRDGSKKEKKQLYLSNILIKDNLSDELLIKKKTSANHTTFLTF